MATFQIKTNSSNLQWIGKKVLGLHSGSILFKGGYLQFTESELLGGEIEVNMDSIVISDIDDPETNQNFLAHLRHEDFFSVERFKTATLRVTGSKKTESGQHLVNAMLTIKDLTHPIQFNTQIEVFNDMLHAFGEMEIDRTLYNMRYGSGKFLRNLGDKLIYDNFNLQFKLIAHIN